MTVVYDDDDGYFVARSEEWPYLAGAEDTPGAAEATLREAIAIAIAGRMKRGFPIPEPRDPRLTLSPVTLLCVGIVTISPHGAFAKADQVKQAIATLDAVRATREG